MLSIVLFYSLYIYGTTGTVKKGSIKELLELHLEGQE